MCFQHHFWHIFNNLVYHPVPAVTCRYWADIGWHVARDWGMHTR